MHNINCVEFKSKKLFIKLETKVLDMLTSFPVTRHSRKSLRGSPDVRHCATFPVGSGQIASSQLGLERTSESCRS